MMYRYDNSGRPIKNYYLVCTVGFTHVLPAETYVDAEKHKKRLRKMGYKKFLVYKRTWSY